MDDVLGGNRRAVVKFGVLAQIEIPRRRVFYLPALGEAALEITLRIIVGTEGAGDLAKNSVKQGHAVAVGVVGFDGFRDSDRHAGLGLGPQTAWDPSNCP